MISFELGQSLYNQGEFQRAAETLEGFCAFADRSSFEYRDAIMKRLRIYTEMDEPGKRAQLEDEILNTLKDLDPRSAAAFYYVQAYNLLLEDDGENAFLLFEKSLQRAIESQCRYSMAQGLIGCIQTSLYLKKSMETVDLKMEKLSLLASQLERPDLNVSVYSLKANLAIQQGHYAQAVEWAWKAYDTVKQVKNHFLGLSMIAKVGQIYLRLGDQEKARFYILLADRSVDGSTYKTLARTILRLREQLNEEPQSDYDLILDERQHLIIEKNKGPIELKNQFLLADLLKLLMQNPGVAFSKEDLAEKIWKQKYDPAVHDNTIYVTIKRMRSLIEPNPNQSKYLLRSRQGYLLSQDLKILIHSKESLL
jgi:DNA-binding winged helix-turn-helix (wHTH) protein